MVDALAFQQPRDGNDRDRCAGSRPVPALGRLERGRLDPVGDHTHVQFGARSLGNGTQIAAQGDDLRGAAPDPSRHRTQHRVYSLQRPVERVVARNVGAPQRDDVRDPVRASGGQRQDTRGKPEKEVLDVVIVAAV